MARLRGSPRKGEAPALPGRGDASGEAIGRSILTRKNTTPFRHTAHSFQRLRCPSCRRPQRRAVTSHFGDSRIACAVCGARAALADWRAAA
jgi:hypothetical protein